MSTQGAASSLSKAGNGKSVNAFSVSGGSRQRVQNRTYVGFLPGGCLALLQNKINFERSAVPAARVMFNCNNDWIDFPLEATEIFRRAFASGTPTAVVDFNGSSWLIDFHRMMGFNLRNETEHSIAWIDVKGKCFFPKMFGGGRNPACDESKFEGESKGLFPPSPGFG